MFFLVSFLASFLFFFLFSLSLSLSLSLSYFLFLSPPLIEWLQGLIDGSASCSGFQQPFTQFCTGFVAVANVTDMHDCQLACCRNDFCTVALLVNRTCYTGTPAQKQRWFFEKTKKKKEGEEEEEE